MPRQGKRLSVKDVTAMVRGSQDFDTAEEYVRDFAEQLIDDAQKAIASGAVLDMLQQVAKMRSEYLR